MTLTFTRKIAFFILIVAAFTIQNANAPFATTADAKTAITTAVAANGPVGTFLALPQIDPAPVTTAITNLKAVQAQFASSTDPKVVAALKDLTDSCITPWTALLATIPNMNNEKASFTTAQTTLINALGALDTSAALAVIAKAKTDATTAVASTTAAIATAINALTTARKAFDTITTDPLFTSGGAAAPAMPWNGAASAATGTSTTATSATTAATAPVSATSTTTTAVSAPTPTASPSVTTASTPSTAAPAPAAT